MSLRLTFSDLYTKIHNQISAPGTPTGDALTLSQSIVYRAYRRLLYPVDMKTKESHIWSWLVKEGTLSLVSGKSEYLLPADFSSLQRTFMYNWNTGQYGAITKTTLGNLMQEKSIASNTSSWPVMCSIVPESVDVSVGQSKKVIFWPVPNGTYQVNYSYICEPPKPTSATDVFMGDAMTDEVLLQMCLAVAEQEVDEQIGVQSQIAEQQLQQLIQKDYQDAPDTAGFIRDGNLGGSCDLRRWTLKNSPFNLEL